jgi:peptidoglycan hydrolase CwlO-like protein
MTNVERNSFLLHFVQSKVTHQIHVMKNNLLIIILLVALMVMTYFYCDNKTRLEETLAQSGRDRDKVTALSKENNKIYTELVTAKEANEALATELKTEQTKYRKAVDDHKKQVADLNAQIKSVRAQLANATTDVALKRELEQLNAQLTQKEAELAEANEMSQNLQNQLNELTTLNTVLIEKSKELRAITEGIGYEMGKLDGGIQSFEGSNGALNIEQVANASFANLERGIAQMEAISTAFSDPVKYPWSKALGEEAAVLKGKLAQKRQAILPLSAQYNTVFVLVGNTKDLLSRGVIKKFDDGGYHVEEAQCEANKASFTKTDRQSPILSLPVSRGDKFALYPAPPEESYTLGNSQSEPSKRSLTIHNSDLFWKNKFLIVRLDH